MLFATIAQPQLFLWMMLSGMVSALWFAAVDGARRLMQAGAALSLLTDTVAAFGMAAILAVFSLWANYGQLRLYGIAGAVCGYALMYFVVIRPLRALLGRLSGGLCAFMRRLSKKRLINIIFK